MNKYQLNNSYFKNRRYDDPADPYEVYKYYQEHKELPFLYEGNNWLLDTFTEYQKRAGVYNNEFFTPDKTAKRMGELAEVYFYRTEVLDMCCGFGQLTKYLSFPKIIGLDNSRNLGELYEAETGNKCIVQSFYFYEGKHDNVISNPPYDIKMLIDFLYKLYDILNEDGKAILLLPSGFVDKERPRRLREILDRFDILDREPMEEDFARTAVKAEIIVVSKQ